MAITSANIRLNSHEWPLTKNTTKATRICDKKIICLHDSLETLLEILETQSMTWWIPKTTHYYSVEIRMLLERLEKVTSTTANILIGIFALIFHQ